VAHRKNRLERTARRPPKVGDFKDVIEPPYFDKIWELLLAKGQENQDLAKQLSIGAGWDKFFFETYQAAARMLGNG
jgi:hypothetical protein